MRAAGTRALSLAAVLTAAALAGRAQERTASSADPRVGLKAGLRDAGEAARNIEKLASMPKPEGFFDPKAPAGPVTPPERDEKAAEAEAAASQSTAGQGAATPSGTAGETPAKPAQPPGSTLGFAN